MKYPFIVIIIINSTARFDRLSADNELAMVAVIEGEIAL
jgi:hypothetical protein